MAGGQEVLQKALAAHGARAGAAAAVGSGECLMQVQVHQVEAHVPGPDHPHHRVQVGPVVVAQAPGVVDDLGDLQDVGVEEAQGVGVGEHEGGHIGAHGGPQGLQVHAPLGVGGHVHHREAAHGGGGGVGAVGGVGDDHLGPGGVPPALVVLLHHQQGGELPVGPGGGLEGHGLHAGDLAQELLRQIEHLQAALDGVGALEGVDAGEAGQGGHLVIHLGVVLHGAGAQGVEPVVHPVGPALQGGIVPGQVHLGDLGKAEGALALHALHQVGGGHVQGGQQVAAPALPALFKQQLHGHTTSRMARSRASISSFVFISVAHHRMEPFSRGRPPRMPRSARPASSFSGLQGQVAANSLK